MQQLLWQELPALISLIKWRIKSIAACMEIWALNISLSLGQEVSVKNPIQNKPLFDSDNRYILRFISLPEYLELSFFLKTNKNMKKINSRANKLVYYLHLSVVLFYFLLFKNVRCRDGVAIIEAIHLNEPVAEVSLAGNLKNRLYDGNAFKNAYQRESLTSLHRETFEGSISNTIKGDQSHVHLSPVNEATYDAQPLAKNINNPKVKSNLSNKRKKIRSKSQWLLKINKRVTNALKGECQLGFLINLKIHSDLVKKTHNKTGLIAKIKRLLRKLQRKSKYKGYNSIKKDVLIKIYILHTSLPFPPKNF
ncbi:expressed protein [Phakopsora pachyrhizi]|uniref:Expressed protein n=1 Tax=Phakopsora pachyrhizi TaxID=170000 RepID=A0AAV0B0S0_PHAPC|nr:expressed protein [Phakopsora pachyrhizi]